MDVNALNTHKMTTRSKRKKVSSEENLVMKVSSIDEIEGNDDFVELSEEFLQLEELDEREELENKKRRINSESDTESIDSEMKGFIVPDNYLSSDEDDLYIPGFEAVPTTNVNTELRAKLKQSENDFAEALASYINNRMIDIESEEDGEERHHRQDEKIDHEDIFTVYDSKMKKYFLGLEEEEQNKILDLETQIKKINNESTPLRYQLLQSQMNVNIKAIAIKKLNSLSSMDNSNTEYYKVKSYLEGLMKIPFGKYCKLPISSSNTQNEITDFMIKSNKILDQAVYGHIGAKSKILQILGKWISNPQSKGSVFAILGPMGNGKTTLVKEGIAKMIQRPFEFISLGGATDSSFLDGHSYTYEGSMPGKVVEIIQKSGCMNPVIYFDELDKVSATPRGEEIINLLIHLTDFSQNDVFMDKYYSDIPIDLSQAVFIFSLNSLEQLNPILRDRMMVIETDKLAEPDKLIISKDYIIPKILDEINLDKEKIIFPDETLKLAIQKYSLEEGVRNLKRCYQTLLEKINIWRLLNFTSNDLTKLNFTPQIQKIFKKPIEFPLTITPNLLESIIEDNKVNDDIPYMMYS